MADNNPQPQQQNIEIKATDEKLAGNYANMMQVSHTKEEFILDFMSLVPPFGQLVSRIIMSPAHAKRVMQALEQNIKNYESQFGQVETTEQPKSAFGFKTE